MRSPSRCIADINWNGWNAAGNFSYSDNWYNSSIPTWGFGSGNLVFSYRDNSSQTIRYYDLSWESINHIIWESSFAAGLVLDGSGNGIIASASAWKTKAHSSRPWVLR